MQSGQYLLLAASDEQAGAGGFRCRLLSRATPRLPRHTGHGVTRSSRRDHEQGRPPDSARRLALFSSHRPPIAAPRSRTSKHHFVTRLLPNRAAEAAAPHRAGRPRAWAVRRSRMQPRGRSFCLTNAASRWPRRSPRAWGSPGRLDPDDRSAPGFPAPFVGWPGTRTDAGTVVACTRSRPANPPPGTKWAAEVHFVRRAVSRLPSGAPRRSATATRVIAIHAPAPPHTHPGAGAAAGRLSSAPLLPFPFAPKTSAFDRSACAPVLRRCSVEEPRRELANRPRSGRLQPRPHPRASPP